MIPDHLRAQKSDFERSLPSTFSATVRTGGKIYGAGGVMQPPTPFNKIVTPVAENDEEKSQKIALLL